MLDRRRVLRTSLSAAAASSIAAWAARSPVKLAHREGNMPQTSSPYVYELAASIPGLSGVEVQTTRSNLWTATPSGDAHGFHGWLIRP